MPKVAGINHLRAVRALGKPSYCIVRQGRKHIVMSDGTSSLAILRSNPFNAFRMAGIVRDAGLSLEEFRELL